jgi:hypothetical protein
VKDFIYRYHLQGYIEVSAATGYNIDKSMKILAELASKRFLNPSETSIVEHVYSFEASNLFESDDRKDSHGLIPEVKRSTVPLLETIHPSPSQHPFRFRKKQAHVVPKQVSSKGCGIRCVIS